MNGGKIQRMFSSDPRVFNLVLCPGSCRKERLLLSLHSRISLYPGGETRTFLKTVSMEVLPAES